MRLWGHRDSGHACKVALALALARVPHEVRVVDIWAAPETRDPRFLAMSPLAEVPLLEIDGLGLTQSGAILLEIAHRFGCLGGESAAGLRRGREILLWEANRPGMCLPQLKEARRPGGGGLPEDVVRWLAARFAADRENFGRLLGDAPFLHGDAPGIGDCAIWGYAQWIDEAGQEAGKVLSDWLARMRALPEMRTPAAFFPS